MNIYEVRFSYQQPEHQWRMNGHRWVLADDARQAIDVVYAEMGVNEMNVDQVVLRGHDVLGLPSAIARPK